MLVSRPWCSLILLPLSLLLVFSGCAALDQHAGRLADAFAPADPVTGARTLNLTSEQQESQQAEQHLAQFLDESRASGARIDVEADPALFAKLQEMLRRIAPISHRPGLPWEVHLIENEAPNAFAIGGGKVFFWTGITKLAQCDEEIAAVMAHEIAHNACRHITEGQSARIVSLFSKSLAKPSRAAYYQAAYTTESEDEADRVSLLYLALAGYDPVAASRIWFRAHEESGSDPGSYLYDHSLNLDRARKTAQSAEIARRYYIGPGQVNPEHERLRVDNDLIPKAQESTGVAALVEAVGQSYIQHQTTKADAKHRKEMARLALQSDPNLQIGIAAHQRGDMQTAWTYYAAAHNSNPQNYYPLYNMACISARIGNTEQAFQLLGMAIDVGFDGAKHMKQDPELILLRPDPRFRALVNAAKDR